MMTRLIAALVLVAVAAARPAPALADHGAHGINFVNQTGQSMSELFIRRTGTTSWETLVAAPPKPGRGAKAIANFVNPDCAFDLKALLDDGAAAEWPSVNLCEVKSLILNRSATGVTWVDYD